MNSPNVVMSPAPIRTSHARRPPAESFLLEQAEIERMLTHNFKTHARLPFQSKPPSDTLPSGPGDRAVQISHIPWSPKSQNAIYPHGSIRSASILRLLPDVQPASPMMPLKANSTEAQLPTNRVFRMHTANKSEGSLQQLNFPHQPYSLGSKSTLRLETPTLKNIPYQRDTLEPGRARSRAPSTFSTLSPGSHPYVSSRLKPLPVDPRQLHRHGTYFQSDDQEVGGDGWHQGDSRPPSTQPSSRVHSRLASPIPHDIAHRPVAEHDDDTRSGISSADLTAPNSNSDCRSNPFDHKHEQTHELGSGDFRNSLPTVDRSPLFTEQDAATVMGFLKRMSARISRKSLIIQKTPEEGGEVSDFSWEAKSIRPTEETETQHHPDQASVPDLDMTETKRHRQLSSASTVSLVLRALDPSQTQGQRPKSELLPRMTSTGTVPPVTNPAGVRRNVSWAVRRDRTPAVVWNTRARNVAPPQMARRRIRVSGKSIPTMPPTARPGLLVRSLSTKTSSRHGDTIYDHGVYHSIIPDLPRSRSLRLASTTSLSAIEERLRRQHKRRDSDASRYSTNTSVVVHGEAWPTRPKPDFSFMQGAVSESPDPRLAPSPQSQVSPLQYHVSSPPDGMNSDTESTKTIPAPTTYLPKRSQSFSTAKTILSPVQNEDGLKSFMDISPEQDVRFLTGSKRKNKLKMLLKRAKIEILSWGRSLVGKPSPEI